MIHAMRVTWSVRAGRKQRLLNQLRPLQVVDTAHACVAAAAQTCGSGGYCSDGRQPAVVVAGLPTFGALPSSLAWLNKFGVNTETERDRHTDRQTYIQTDIQTYIHTDIQTDRQREGPTDRQIYRQTDRETDRQTDRQR